jgi:hypothetical protein
MIEERRKEPADQGEIFLAIRDLRSSIVSELTKDRVPFWWKVVQLAMPVVLTISLGFFVWLLQSNIQHTLSLQAQKFTAELGLRQFLFERRLAAYTNIYNKASAAYLSIKADDPQAVQDHLDNEVKVLSELANESKILSSAEFQKLLLEMWIQVAQRRNLAETENLLDKLARQMRADLRIDEMDKLGR